MFKPSYSAGLGVTGFCSVFVPIDAGKNVVLSPGTAEFVAMALKKKGKG